jgi:hypothetical protein
VPSVQIQPAGVFPLWFEDGSGAKEMAYYCTTPESFSSGCIESLDTLYGEIISDFFRNSAEAMSLRIVNLLGEEVDCLTVTGKAPWLLNQYPKGIYLLKRYDLAGWPRGEQDVVVQ